MKRIIGTAIAAIALAVGLGACHSTNAGTVCRDIKPTASVSVTVAYTSSSGQQSVCEGRNSGGRYFWAVNNADHRILYNNFYPF